MANRHPAKAGLTRLRRPWVSPRLYTVILSCNYSWGAAGALGTGGLTLISSLGKAATSSPSEVTSAAARRARAAGGTPFRGAPFKG